MTKQTDGQKHPSRRRIIKIAAAAAAGITAPSILRISPALAAYPERPVKIVVANTPGGPSDLIGRMVAAALEQKTGKTFIIENKGGAGGNIGMGYAANAEPDGYTIMLITNAFSVNVGLYNKIPYKVSDFVPISELAFSPNTFVVQSSLPAKNIKEFIELAKKNSGKFNVSTPPIGTVPHLLAEMFRSKTKLTNLDPVVFKGGGDALQAVLSGTVQLSSGSLPPAASHIKAGTLRCLAVTSEKRWPDLPNVPTMIEEGYKDMTLSTDAAMLAPAKTPKEITSWLEKEIVGVLSSPEMKAKMFKAGFEVRPQGAQAAWSRVMKEIDIFKDVIETSKLTKI